MGEGWGVRRARVKIVGQAAVYRMQQVIDMRGNLTVGEFGGDFPFEPKRYFAVFDVPSEKLRGEHAHYACQHCYRWHRRRNR